MINSINIPHGVPHVHENMIEQKERLQTGFLQQENIRLTSLRL